VSVLSPQDRAVVRQAVAHTRSDRQLLRALVVERAKPKKNRRRRARQIAGVVIHCVYCGGHAKGRGACHAHSDLPALDPFFEAVFLGSAGA
jgi:hypothetical protein